jgi:hypothetical protein
MLTIGGFNMSHICTLAVDTSFFGKNSGLIKSDAFF